MGARGLSRRKRRSAIMVVLTADGDAVDEATTEKRNPKS
jgi:hypothetical protein